MESSKIENSETTESIISEVDKVIINTQLNQLLESEESVSQAMVDDFKFKLNKSNKNLIVIKSIYKVEDCCVYYLPPVANPSFYLINNEFISGGEITLCGDTAFGFLIQPEGICLIKFICLENYPCDIEPVLTVNAAGCCVYFFPEFENIVYTLSTGTKTYTSTSVVVCPGNSITVTVLALTGFWEDPYHTVCSFDLTCDCCDSIDIDYSITPGNGGENGGDGGQACCQINFDWTLPQCANPNMTPLRGFDPPINLPGVSIEEGAGTNTSHSFLICGSYDGNITANFFVRPLTTNCESKITINLPGDCP